MSIYYRPIPKLDPIKGTNLLPLAGGHILFDEVEILERNKNGYTIAASEIPLTIKNDLIRPRPRILDLPQSDPAIMGIINITPDSFSDGQKDISIKGVVQKIRKMVEAGVNIIDIGGESTRPGFEDIPVENELSRVIPVIESIRKAGLSIPISVDTRKAIVAKLALTAGANMVNDVSGMDFDKDMVTVIKNSGAPICLMHSGIGTEKDTKPYNYENVLLDVYDSLAKKITTAVKCGIPKSKIIIDPGIGFNKNLEQNLILLNRLSLFHALGCRLLLGASRKRFIGTITGESQPNKRLIGSLVVGLEAIKQGVQVLRVHDTAEHNKALSMWKAIVFGRGG